MKTKEIKFKYKKILHVVSVPDFGDIREAIKTLGEAEVFKSYQFGQIEIAKLMETGRNPFKMRKTRIILKIDSLTEEQKSTLAKLGLFPQK